MPSRSADGVFVLVEPVVWAAASLRAPHAALV